MTRKIDLVSYLPPFLAEYKEISAALEAENPEFMRLQEAAERVLKNGFIETADAYGLTRFEKILNIIPKAQDSLEDRRAKIKVMWNAEPPYTSKWLFSEWLYELFPRQLLPNPQSPTDFVLYGIFVGSINCDYGISITINYNKIKKADASPFTRKLMGTPDDRREIAELIEDKLPMNMVLTLRLFFEEVIDGSNLESVSVTLTKNSMWRLDGTENLSGVLKLNAAVIKEEI